MAADDVEVTLVSPARRAAARPTPVESTTPEAAPEVVALDRVTRSFGPNPALVDLSMTVTKGSITVLLGPNGAGKTTCTRVITGALEPQAGTVRVFDQDPTVNGRDVRARCGVVSAKPALYDRLSGRDNLRYAAELYGLGRSTAAETRIDESADRFGIVDALTEQVGGYSTGMKTRLALARSILHGPDLLLYDEPTSGLDPESSYAVLDLIRQMTTEDKTVLMCTHLLVEAEGLADRVVILQDGTSILEGAPNTLMTQWWPTPTVVIEVESTADGEYLDALAGRPEVSRYERAATTATMGVESEAVVADLVQALASNGVRIRRVDPHRPTLEELYFAARSDAGSARLSSVAGPGGTTP